MRTQIPEFLPARGPVVEVGVGYNIYRSNVLLGTSSTTAYAVTGLAPDTNNNLTVRATDMAGNLSAASVVLAVRTLALPPSIPLGLTAASLKPASFTLKWTASIGGTGGIVGYEVYLNGILVGSPSARSLAFTGLKPQTSYALTVLSLDSVGNRSAPSTPFTVTTPADTAKPTAPKNLSAANVTTNSFTLTWTASTDNVGVAGYDVHRNNVLVGFALTPAFTVSGLAPSTLSSMRVKARDAAGNISGFSTILAITTSAPPNIPPAVALTAPAAGSAFTRPFVLTLFATAADSDGTIAKVEFFAGPEKLGEATVADPGSPTTFTFPLPSGLAAGLYSLTARATDNRNATTDSAPVMITVNNPNQSPVVTLAASATGTAPAFLSLSADASDSDGTITKVEFYEGTVLLGEGLAPTIAPATYSFPLTLYSAGTYTLTAVATDNSGTATTSAPLVVQIASGAALLPYVANFEPAEGYTAGPLLGQHSWFGTGGVTVATAAKPGSQQQLAIAAAQPPEIFSHAFSAEGVSPVFVDFMALPVAGADPASAIVFSTPAAQVALVGNGAPAQLWVFGGGMGWYNSGQTVATDTSGRTIDWLRLTTREDYLTKKWDLYLNGQMVGADIAFADATATALTDFSVNGHATVASAFDSFYAGAENALFADENRNGLDDAWETAHGLSLAMDNRQFSPTGNGVTVLQAYLAGTDPNDFYNGLTPVITMLDGGDGALGPDGLIRVRVANSGGQPLGNAPVIFLIPEGISRLASSSEPAASVANTLSLMTQADGTAEAYYRTPTGQPINGVVRVQAGLASVQLVFQTQDTGENQPPAVTLTAPLDGAALNGSFGMVIAASAYDPEDAIAKVEFFADGTKLGESTTAPYYFCWNNPSLGSHTIAAKVKDNLGSTTTSPAISITYIPTSPAFLANDFELSGGFTLGQLSGQHGWSAFGEGVMVTNEAAQSGTQSMVILPTPVHYGSYMAELHLGEPVAANAVRFIDFWIKPVSDSSVSAASSITLAGGPMIGFVRTGGTAEIQGYRQDEGMETQWLSGMTVPVDEKGITPDWHRLTIREDIAAYKLDVYLDGQLALTDVYFYSGDDRISINGHPYTSTRLDNLRVLSENPLFIDADRDGMEDSWEASYSLNTTIDERYSDADGDGRSNLHEFRASTDPQDSFNGILPLLSIVSGDNQSSAPGQFNADPLVVAVTDANGLPLSKALVTFRISSGSGLFGLSTNGSLTSSVALHTTDDGKARVYYQQPAIAGARSQILVSAGTAQVTLSSISTDPNADTDGDGLSDSWETDHGYDPLHAETSGLLSSDDDHDGLTLVQEARAGTDPGNSDTDDDGLSDGVEVSRRLDPISNDADHDNDGDGVSNRQEIANNTDPNDLYNGLPLTVSNADLLSLIQVRVLNADGLAPPHAPVRLSVASGSGSCQFADAPSGVVQATTPLTVYSDTNGTASGYVVFTKFAPVLVDIALPYGTSTQTYSIMVNPPDTDIDANGMPDLWEVLNFGGTGVDPLGDPDNDGFPNISEYYINTDPHDGNSPFRTVATQYYPYPSGVGMAAWNLGSSSGFSDNYFMLPAGVSGPVYWTKSFLSIDDFDDNFYHNAQIPSTLMAAGSSVITGPITQLLTVYSPSQLGVVYLNFAFPEIAVDANRDSMIKLGVENSSDFVPVTNPFFMKICPMAAQAAELPGTSHVAGLDDLKQYVPLFLSIQSMVALYPPGNGITYRLKQADGALDFVYTNLDRSRFYSYLSSLSATGFGPALAEPSVSATTTTITADGVDLFSGTTGSSTFLQAIRENEQYPPWGGGYGIILVKAHKASTQPLVLAIEKNGSTIGAVKLPLMIAQIQLAVDANRDGDIKFASEDASDTTAADKPCRFWLNDDIDRTHVTNNTYFETTNEQDDLDSSPDGKLDWEENTIPCQRDLEDFARLWVSTMGLNTALKNGDMKLGLKWSNVTSGTPAVKLYRAADADGSTGYLFTPATAQQQIDPTGEGYGNAIGMTPEGGGASTTVVEGSNGFIFPATVFGNLTDAQPKTFLLFEGCKAGVGQLQLVIYDKNGVKIGDGPGVYLDLQPIRGFYQSWTVGDNTSSGVQKIDQPVYGYAPVPPATTYSPVAGSPALAAPATEEEKDFILFVHGWNMQVFEKDNFAETAFKRLYWQGYKGRFGFFRWPTFYTKTYLDPTDTLGPPLDPANFDGSELNSWRSATGLLQLLNTLKGTYCDSSGNSRVRVFAHSHGNIATSEALRKASAPLVHTYVASQAALAAHCFDRDPDRVPDISANWQNGKWYLDLAARLGLNPVSVTTPNVYAYYPGTSGLNTNVQYPTAGQPYMTGAKGSGKWVNYYNQSDWALDGWTTDQALKPDIGYNYSQHPGGLIPGDPDGWWFYSGGGFFYRLMLIPEDTYEIFSFAAQARSQPLGRQPGVGGLFNGQEASWNKYGDKHPGHSAEFRSSIAERSDYWATLLDSFNIIQRRP